MDSGVTEGFETDLVVSFLAMDGKASEYTPISILVLCLLTTCVVSMVLHFRMAQYHKQLYKDF